MLGGCPQPTEETKDKEPADTTAPALAASGSQLAINNVKKTLTVGFSEEVKITIKTRIQVFKGTSKTPLDAGEISGIAGKSDDAAKIVITLADAFQEQYRFIPARCHCGSEWQ